MWAEERGNLKSSFSVAVDKRCRFCHNFFWKHRAVSHVATTFWVTEDKKNVLEQQRQPSCVCHHIKLTQHQMNCCDWVGRTSFGMGKVPDQCAVAKATSLWIGLDLLLLQITLHICFRSVQNETPFFFLLLFYSVWLRIRGRRHSLDCAV